MDEAKEQFLGTLGRRRSDVDGPAFDPDDWSLCRARAAAILKNRWVLLLSVFLGVFGIGYAAIAEESVGWAIVGSVAAMLALLIGADNIKFWLMLYPLVFLIPRLRIGALSEQGEKLLGIQLYEPWILLLFFVWVSRLVARKQFRLPRVMKYMLFSLAIVGLLGFKIAPDRMLALKVGGRTFFEPLFLFAAFSSVSWDKAELRRVVNMLITVAAVVVCLSIFQYGFGEGVETQGLGRLHSYWEGTNVLAVFIGAVMPVTLGSILSISSRVSIVLGLSSLLLSSLALVLTYTRGVWLGTCAVVGFMMARLRIFLWGAAAVVLALLVLSAGPPHVQNRVKSIIHFEEERSAINRLDLWPKVAGFIAERPLTGYGFGSFYILFRDMAGMRGHVHAHNIFLDFAVTLGVPGLALFLGLVGYTLLKAFAAFKRSALARDRPLLLGLWGGCIVLIVSGLFDGSVLVWPILSHIFWFLLALTYAYADATSGFARPISWRGGY